MIFFTLRVFAPSSGASGKLRLNTVVVPGADGCPFRDGGSSSSEASDGVYAVFPLIRQIPEAFRYTEEAEAFLAFLKDRPISMIQWRNLNFDPLRYCQIMSQVTKHGTPIGMKSLLDSIHEAFPKLIYGYFNPPKESF